MSRGYQYYLLLILSLLTISSLYLGFTAETGFGDVSVQTIEIEDFSGINSTCKVFSTRIRTYSGDYPVVLTIPDFGQSFDSLYAINIELARRNFTVISFDLSNENSASLTENNQTYLEDIGQRIYSLFISYANKTSGVSNDTYGVIGYSFGFQIALELNKTENSPRSFIALGDQSQLSLPTDFILPGNSFFALGQNPSNIDTILRALENATGVTDVQESAVYGIFHKQTAYGYEIFHTPISLQLHDMESTQAIVEWSIKSIQGNLQFNQSLQITDTVFQYRTYAVVIAPISFFATLIPLFMILITILPSKFQFQKLRKHQNPVNPMKAFGISTFLGIITTMITISALNLSYSIIAFMGALLVSLYLSAFILSLGNRRSINKMIFNTANIFYRKSRYAINDILLSLFVLGCGLIWIEIWLYFTPFITIFDSWIITRYFYSLSDLSVLGTVILLSIPIFLYQIVESLIIRGLALSERDYNGNYRDILNIGFSTFSRLIVVSIITVVVWVLAIGGQIFTFQTGLYLVYFTLLTFFSTLTISWAAIQAKNPFPAIIWNTLVYAIILATIF